MAVVIIINKSFTVRMLIVHIMEEENKNDDKAEKIVTPIEIPKALEVLKPETWLLSDYGKYSSRWG